MAVALTEITSQNLAAVLALRVAPAQEQFVGSVQDALADAARYPHARPWYRAVTADGEPVGFIMLSWDVEPQPPHIIGPWFLWKLLIDQQHQRRGYGSAAVRQAAALIRAEGARELLTSYVPDDNGPAGFYARLQFIPTGQLDSNGEIIARLAPPLHPRPGYHRSPAQAQRRRHPAIRSARNPAHPPTARSR